MDERPGLTTALDYLRDGDMLTVQEVDRLGRNLLEGLIVLNDLFQRGFAVKVLEGEDPAPARRPRCDLPQGLRGAQGSVAAWIMMVLQGS